MRLIDLFVNKGRLWAWVLEGSENRFLECDFSIEVYVLARSEMLLYVRDMLAERGIKSFFEMRKTLGGNRRVLGVSLGINELKGVLKYIKGLCNCEIFNSDVPVEIQFMFQNRVFPTCSVELQMQGDKVAGMSTSESPFEEYEIPKMKTAHLGLTTSVPLQRSKFAVLEKIQLNDCAFQGDEKRMIQGFVLAFQLFDPDVIVTQDGELELPYLLQTIRRYFPRFSFSRFGYDNLRTEGHSYFTYGRVIHKYSSVKLKGRLHLRNKGTLYGSWSMAYPFELARLCYLPLQDANSRSIGYCCSNRQLFFAVQHGFLLPGTSSCVERWKTGLELFNADRGSMILEPEIGYHDNVAEIDFISLFPSIMVRENISTETLFCRCCKENRVPGLNMNVCIKTRGIMGDVLEPIIEQRQHYKRAGKHKERAEALKGLLVTSFGYMGFRKSKFARIEAHQAIQAYAREILLRAIRIAEEHGFEVLHGVVDSLWVKKEGITERDVQGLIAAIESEIGYRAKNEGLYKWIVFLPSTMHSDVPVPTRYYGVFKSGEVKCRGIELRRHDTPGVIKQLQIHMIKELSGSSSYGEFTKRLGVCEGILRDAIARLHRGYVPKEELIITKGLSKSEYGSASAQAIVAEKLKEAGYAPVPGDYARYIITNKASTIHGNRYSIDSGVYDKGEYTRLMRRSFENISSAFKRSRQLSIHEALRNDTTRAKAQELSVQVQEGAV